MDKIYQVLSEPSTWFLSVLLLVLLPVLIRAVRRRRSKGGLKGLVDTVGVDRVSDILVSDGMGGEIYIDHLLLTGKGLVVLDVKTITGTVFASDQMDEWTVMTPKNRISIQNPQGALHNRIAALRLLVRNVPVFGHVLFVERTDFSKGRPKDVILAEELLERYRKPEKRDLDSIMEAFLPYWETVCEACKPASTTGP
jgi:hypothetical protein